MGRDYGEFSTKELSVILDALFHYCGSASQRNALWFCLRGRNAKRLDDCVIMAQLDEKAVDERDRQYELTGLIEKKENCFEEFNQIALRLYHELLDYLESNVSHKKEE